MIRFEPIDIAKHRMEVIRFRKDSFKVRFGETSNFGDEEEYLLWLGEKTSKFPESFVLVEQESKNIGYVNLYNLIPDMRGKGKELQDYAMKFFINN